MDFTTNEHSAEGGCLICFRNFTLIQFNSLSIEFISFVLLLFFEIDFVKIYLFIILIGVILALCIVLINTYLLFVGGKSFERVLSKNCNS